MDYIGFESWASCLKIVGSSMDLKGMKEEEITRTLGKRGEGQAVNSAMIFTKPNRLAFSRGLFLLQEEHSFLQKTIALNLR